MSLPRRSPSADAAPAAPAFCFSIRAAADPGVMPRVLALFAKRGLVPSKLHAALVEAGALEIDVQVAELGEDTGRYIADCLRQQVEVDAVLTAVRPR
jgi:acetolactate synthase small subunit